MRCIICDRDLEYDEIESIIADKCLCSIECIRVYFNRQEEAEGYGKVCDLPPPDTPSGGTD